MCVWCGGGNLWRSKKEIIPQSENTCFDSKPTRHKGWVPTPASSYYWLELNLSVNQLTHSLTNFWWEEIQTLYLNNSLIHFRPHQVTRSLWVWSNVMVYEHSGAQAERENVFSGSPVTRRTDEKRGKGQTLGSNRWLTGRMRLKVNVDKWSYSQGKHKQKASFYREAGHRFMKPQTADIYSNLWRRQEKPHFEGKQ